ncbi:acetate--CoA ligase family protein [Nocardioides sp. L-11A]|uniref:acetate--CoA ligase family protein n=1 Tax=Nocardioides sp. L-11A TaxID=3043848 RepID=UPI002499BDF9|nr:acetate--CoA ligase family protein [Nocardioides sp. L-11A]
MAELAALLDPASIAVVGASPRGNRGSQILENLRRFGSTARIHPVHPTAASIAGYDAVPDLGSLPEPVDFVAVALGAEPALDVLEEAIAGGARAGLLIASGFGEGATGGERRERLSRLVGESDFLLCGPNCYGILNATTGFAAYSGQIVTPFAAGRVALVMQSGALTHAVTDSSIGRGLGLSHLITTGNEVSVTLGQYVAALAEDPGVDVIGVFLEGLRDAEEFARAAIRAAEVGKTVVALSVGRSELGQRAALAHTGAVAGHSEALAGLLRRCGVVQADDLDEFREMLILFSSRIRPTARGLAVASISGGGSGLVADRMTELGIPAARLGERATAELTDVLPDFATVANPLDLTGAAAEDSGLASAALTALRSDPRVGLVALALNVLQGCDGQAELYREQARVLAKQAAQPGAPVVAFGLAGGPADPAIVEVLSEQGVPLLGAMTPALTAIGALMASGAAPEPWVARPTVPRRELGRSVIAGQEALELLSTAGIETPAAFLVADEDAVKTIGAALPDLAVVKVESPGLAHKTEVGGVRTGLAGTEAVARAVAEMRAAIAAGVPDLAVDGFLVQQQVTGPVVECMVGVVRDPQVGPVLTVAPGGVLAELGGRALTTPVPITRREVERMLDSSPLGRLLDGYRGAPRADRTALIDLVVAFGELVDAFGSRLATAELNPVLVRPEGRGAVAVDALFIREEL